MPTQIASEPSWIEGSFEYIEAKIRRDAEGTTFGGDFEWLCQWFLENAPRYRGQFETVWLWKDWPDRWGPDAGIDIVARTRTGELWAIQAKAFGPHRTIPKSEIDSFLSESNRPQFAYRLLMATTDDIGATARRSLHGQEKPVGLVLRGHFLTEEVQWPVQIGGTASRLPRWEARLHQAAAIDAVVNGYRDHDRGQLIMACGTGKTLTALWIAERLQSSLTLVLVPSLSLVQQNLAEWGRHSTQDFDTLVVCSDESVVQRNEDTALQSTADLGVKVTTKSAEIQEFLVQHRKRPAAVFATYQSSDRIATAQAGTTKQFDLAICDESHRLAGHAEGLFATVLDGKKIKASKRLFMTATPRYFKDHVKRRAAELELELVSMDDAHVFGPEFHVLTFHEAINAKPEPLLTDYQVVVIGVTDREAQAWAEEARFVRTADGLRTDARTLAAQIGLAKAMRKYDLRKIITFHSSVAKAARFVDATLRDSLPGVIPHLTESSRPSGELWTKHISGHTPAGQRATLLKGLGNLPDGTRGILSNCACLGEGVDVPVLDAVAFIDPKRSMVDIIQAVGRVIRKAVGKQIGTIVIPVFIDESEDADHVLSQSAFEPVWQVLKALRAHDRRLADQLDQLRLSLGRWSESSGQIKLPTNIVLDAPQLLQANFEQAFYVRTVEQTTDTPPLTIEQILAWADAHKTATGEWPRQTSGQVTGTEESWTRLSGALQQGQRGLPRGSSLAKLLAEHRGVRNQMDLPDLTIEQILVWVDAHKSATGDWPRKDSGQITGTDESWAGINSALKIGFRGLRRGSTLAKLLGDHRGVRNHRALPNLTTEQILVWADAYKMATGEWPKVGSGPVAGTNETWGRIEDALLTGGRGLPGGSSLARLLAEH
ncbi:MAG: DEAD/DEAH box helicase family protein [Planctomycetaceae bacterium]